MSQQEYYKTAFYAERQRAERLELELSKALDENIKLRMDMDIFFKEVGSCRPEELEFVEPYPMNRYGGRR